MSTLASQQAREQGYLWFGGELLLFALCFFFNDTATTEIYTLSLHDALPIRTSRPGPGGSSGTRGRPACARSDRKSTRLNSSHVEISYAVFCLKKKKNNK